MRKLIFTFWMDGSKKYPEGATLVIKVSPDYEVDHRPRSSFIVNGAGEFIIGVNNYEIVDDETTEGWARLFALEVDGNMLSVKSKLRNQQYFHIDLPEVIRE